MNEPDRDAAISQLASALLELHDALRELSNEVHGLQKTRDIANRHEFIEERLAEARAGISSAVMALTGSEHG